MGRRNRRQRANERRRKLRTNESESEIVSDEQSRENPYPPSDTDVDEAEARGRQMQNMHNLSEIKVEVPISNARAPEIIEPEIIDRRRKVNSFHKAVLRGDWTSAKTALSSGENIGLIEITERRDTALHIAAATKQTAFVRNVVPHLNTDVLELKNREGYTAFSFAAVSGVVEIAEIMLKQNKNLPTIPNREGKTPLEIAISLGHRKMVEFLYEKTPLEDLKAREYINILLATIHTDMYDIALKILYRQGIQISTTDIRWALKALAGKTLRVHGFQGHRRWERLVSIIATIPCIPYFRRIHSKQEIMKQARELVKVLCDRITSPYSDIYNLTQDAWIFDDAAKFGNVEFLNLLIDHSYPDLFWKFNQNYRSILRLALINRQEKVFSLIYQIGAVKHLITLYRDHAGNNVLHLAGKLASRSRLEIVSGAALQMQREVQWFKEVQKIVPSSFLHMRNNHGLTPRELFSMEHWDLRREGEMWMKNTVSFCLVVATLIATVAFAAAITIPGGNNQESGTPILLKDEWFKVFVISNAVAMFSSTTSIVIYLSILTSPYVEDDFLFSLPAQLMFGLFSVVVSIFCMVLTFSATFFSVYDEENQGPLRGLVAGLACLPVIIYPMLNYKFWNTIVFSTGWTAMLTSQPVGKRLY
ncbi:ankyrin repeat-containing At5g02620-like [Olea europaea subsp. europaea]|uniref:Ankyrin repeat-containing At5g02620-like n=1 Tax=Olea europaea subsp. europaea TaxID=158383 RepID=A0A8S0TD52_OLEEU|nr:ankyrin repeat-containing At5g02620-like [Olea europaea subsp. europaea]